MNHDRDRRDRGAVTVWVLGLTVVIGLLGWVSLAIYVPFSERRALAAEADQAAQAGATALDEDHYRQTGIRQLDPDTARERALEHLERQDLDIDPQRSSVFATPTEVVVTLHTTVDSAIVQVLNPGSGPLTIRVTATGTPRESAP